MKSGRAAMVSRRIVVSFLGWTLCYRVAMVENLPPCTFSPLLMRSCSEGKWQVHCNTDYATGRREGVAVTDAYDVVVDSRPTAVPCLPECMGRIVVAGSDSSQWETLRRSRR